MTEPTRYTTYHGDVVNQHGDHNIGIQKGAAAPDPALRAAVEELSAELRALLVHLDPEQARTVEAALPALAPDRAALERQALTLARLGQLAAVVGPLAQPVADALGRLLGLLGM
ncbi:hypothetical protein ACF1BN_18205 [Streptomyces sp. NPDC014861]|uniref:hypothetical protein n=1 Tax=Streptomyces sp. NPDC014861 TaxID=3364923 RepID=UPI0036FB02A8